MDKPQGLHINRGVELLLRRKRREPPAEPKTFEASFAPMIIAIVAINNISNIINF